MLPLNRFSRRSVPVGGLPIVRHWRREEGLRGNGNAPSEKCPPPCIQLGDFFKRLAAGALAPDGDDHGGDKAEEAEDPEHAVEAVRSVGHRDEGWAAATARRPVELWKPVAVLRIRVG